MKFPIKFLYPLLGLLVLLITSSCANSKNIVYFQGLDDVNQVVPGPETNVDIKSNDHLTITVSAFNREAAAPYNMAGISSNEATASTTPYQYVVDSDGNIEFPGLGTMEVAGMTRKELTTKLRNDLAAFVKDPIVNVRIVNFQISVLGEVNTPGTFTINDEYLSIPKALGLAGDMTIFGLRDNVLVMREQNGQKVHAYLDLSDANVINSPFYYLQQNDVVYVEPNKVQKQRSGISPNTGIYFSIASLLLSIAILITR